MIGRAEPESCLQSDKELEIKIKVMKRRPSR